MKNANPRLTRKLQRLACSAIVIAASCGATCGQEDGPTGPDDAAPETQVETDDADGSRGRGTQSYWDAEQRRVQALFEQPIKYEFFETSLAEVMELLSTEHGFNHSIDVAALDALGLDCSLPISHRMNGVCLRQALDLILAPHDLAYVIREGIVMVTSDEDADEMLTTKIYPVRDLLHAQQPHESMDQLIAVITGAIAPDSWEEVGGPASIHPYQGVLTISQTDRIHAAVDQMLSKLRLAVNASGGPTIPMPAKPACYQSGQKPPSGGVFDTQEANLHSIAPRSTTEESR
jgi:hypothetical protein